MNLEVNWGQPGRSRSGSLMRLQSNGNWGHLRSSSYTCLALGLGSSHIAGGVKRVWLLGHLSARGLSPCSIRVIVLFMSRLKAPCECTRRNWQELPVSADLASAATQHHLDCIWFIEESHRRARGQGQELDTNSWWEEVEEFVGIF